MALYYILYLDIIPKMKPHRLSYIRARNVLIAALAALSPIGSADLFSADIIKANDATSLELPASWVGGVAPGLDDIAVFDSSLDAGLSVPFTGNLSFRGIRVSGNAGNLTITGLAEQLLTLGRDGLDFSAASPGGFITFDGPRLVLQAGTAQSWSIASGASSILYGNLTSDNAGVVVDSPGATPGTIIAEGFGAPDTLLSPNLLAKTDAGLNFATLDISDRRIIPANALGVVSPGDGGVPTAAAVLAAWPTTGYLEVTNSNGLPTATAFQINASLFPGNAPTNVPGGIRFNQPHSTPGTPWVVGFGAGGRIQPGVPFAFLVTPGVGASDVIFSRGGGGQEFRFSGTGTRLIFQQYNTLGNLIWRGDIGSSPNSPLTTVTKTGPGRLIMANPSFAPSLSTVYITEGILQLGEGNATGTFNNEAIVNNGSLVFNRSGSFSHSGVISGTGSLVFNTVAGGDVTLSGANTYSGSTTINGGAVILGNASALGASSSITLAGGGITYAAGVTTDLSSQAAVAITGNTTINLNANNVTLANSIGGGGAGGIIKAGTGTLTLAGGNTYTGNTTVAAGGLKVTNSTGSATGPGNVSFASATSLSGAGAIAGAVTTSAGTLIAPGNGGVGTLTLGGLALAPSSIVDVEFGSVGSYDKIITTTNDGLTINGGNLHLYSAGTTNAWAVEGSYNLFQYSGLLQGSASALSVLNPQAGYEYTFGTSGGFVTLNILQDAILSDWVSSSGGSWASSANWDANGVPTSGHTALFVTNLGAPATVTLDGNRVINGAVFTSSPNGYTLAQGTGGTLTLDKGIKNVAINVNSGSHVISAPVALASTVAVSTSTATDVNTSLTFSGAVSGAGGVIKSGPGLLNMSGHNTFTGSILATGGVLAFGHADSLGTGAITLDGAGLRYNAGNTADISGRSITVGQDGASIDTNDNDVVFANPFGNNGIGAFTKKGLGSLTVANANTYLGATYINGGELIISGSGALGSPALAMPLHLNGGLLVPTASFTLDNAGANPRPVVVDAGGGGFLTAAGVTLTVNGSVGGSGTLSKAGAGDLVLTANNSSTFSGPVSIEAGAVRLGASQSIGQTGLGTGPITFAGNSRLHLNSAGLADNAAGFGTLTNGLVVSTGVVADLFAPARGAFTGAVSGAGTLNYHVDGIRWDTRGDWPAFTGQLNILKTPTGAGTEIDQYRMSVGNHNMSAAKVRVGAGIETFQSFNPPANAIGQIHQFGELTVDEGGFLGGNTVGGRFNIYQVGALNTNFTINGQFRGNIAGAAFAYPGMNKVGTGTLTLNNRHMMRGPINVNGGTLSVRGTIERFYNGFGVDGVQGTADDTISVTPPATAFAPLEPGTFVVGASGTLGGDGALGGAVTVNGSLRPDSGGTLGGQLSFTGASVLTLGATATTTFDFGGTVFTGVKSTVAGGFVYGGALKLNFLGTLYNGSYPLFELNGAPSGAFTGVSATTTNTANAPLTDTAGTWAGTVDGVSLSFNSATGVLTVSGGATAVLPGIPGGVTATAGSGQVVLGWNAVANASSYIVKRSTVPGGPYIGQSPESVTTAKTDAGLINGTTYYYVIQARNAAGLSANSPEVSATPVEAPPRTALEQWRFDEFGVDEDTEAVLAGDLEDFDGDGLVNILEYALGTDPTVANASPVLVGRTGNNLTLTYPRRAVSDPALTYSVLGSGDLTAGFTAGLGGTNTVGATSTYTDNVDLSVAGTRRFLRLSVTYTAP